MKFFVTGGAGFIGSHLADELLKLGEVTVYDNLSLGKKEHIEHNFNNPLFKFIKADLLDFGTLKKSLKGHDVVFHFAANSDIQKGARITDFDLQQGTLATYNVLEAIRLNNVKEIIFSSSSAIYGKINKLLHEDAGPLFPISFYGAAKLGSEAYISAFSANFNIRSWILRFPNVVGERATHGIVFDFINKLKENPRELTILGDGKQEKPYVYVKDLIEGVIFAWENSNDRINCFNLGVDSTTTATKIAEIIVKEMGLKGVKFRYVGGSGGWLGDVPSYQYDLYKISKLGWKAKKSSDEAVKVAVRAIAKK